MMQDMNYITIIEMQGKASYIEMSLKKDGIEKKNLMVGNLEQRRFMIF